MAKLPGLDKAIRGAKSARRSEGRLHHPEDAEMMPELYAAVVRGPSRLATWALAVIVGSVIVFVLAAAVIPLDEVTRVDGEVIPSGQTQLVAHPYGGVVEDILVREGEEVKQGQTLLRIGNREAEAEFGETRARVAALAALAARLRAEANKSEDVEFPQDIAAASPQATALERQFFRARRESLLSQLKDLEEQRRQRELELKRQESIVDSLEKKLPSLRAQIGHPHSPAADRKEIAVTADAPIVVPLPGAGQALTISVVAGRPLKLGFYVADVKTREVVKDDLVLEFDDGGKVVLKEYMTAFGMLGEVRTTVIQPDGKRHAFSDLLAPSMGQRGARPAAGAHGDVVIIQKPPAGETQTFKLIDDKPMALNFGFRHLDKSQIDKHGNLVLTFKDNAVLVLEGYTALKDQGIDLYFAKGDKVALADLAAGARREGAGIESGNPLRAGVGHDRRLDILRLQRAIHDAEDELAAERLKILRLQAAILEARQKHVDRKQDFIAEARHALNDTESEIARLKEKLEKLTFDAKTIELKTPLRGIVKQLRVATKGGTVKAGEPLVAITPLDDTLVMEGRVRPNDIAFVRIGQHALVRITAYSYAAYGALEGNVIEISRDAIGAPEKPSENHVRVKIRIMRSFLEQDGKRLPIGPGMTAEASIKIGTKSLLAYILKPLDKAKRHIEIDEPQPGDPGRRPEPGRTSTESL